MSALKRDPISFAEHMTKEQRASYIANHLIELGCLEDAPYVWNNKEECLFSKTWKIKYWGHENRFDVYFRGNQSITVQEEMFDDSKTLDCVAYVIKGGA